MRKLFNDSFGLAPLVNKYCNLAADLPPLALTDTSQLKSIVGRDVVSINRKFLPRVDVKLYAKLVNSANILPPTVDLSPAFFFRWCLLEFNQRFYPQAELDALPGDMPPAERAKYHLQDPQKIEYILAYEMPGIFNWALDGLKRLILNKAFSGRMLAKEVELMWLQHSNSFAIFLEKHCEISYGRTIVKQELQQAYSHFCLTNKLQVASAKKVHEYLMNQGVGEAQQVLNGERRYIWAGICLKTPIGVKNEL
jgi:putative DNA primase/helicase